MNKVSFQFDVDTGFESWHLSLLTQYRHIASIILSTEVNAKTLTSYIHRESVTYSKI